MLKGLQDIYTDYFLMSFLKTTATGLSELTENEISHDKITRMLNGKELTTKDLWMLTKKIIRKHETEEGIIIIDDTTEEKQYTTENDIVCWHYDHAKRENVKGINIVNCVYHNEQITIPIGFKIVEKHECCDIKTGKQQRKSNITKNEIFREMLETAAKNNVKYKWILADIWYASSDNMIFINGTLKKKFMMPVKGNRLVALSEMDYRNKKFINIENVEWSTKPTQLWLKGVGFQLLAHKQVFTNKDNSVGFLYLITNNLNSSTDLFEYIYQKRWNIETFHKTLKQNASLGQSPTKTLLSQSNHIFFSFLASVKLELISIQSHFNHFALKSKLYIAALKHSFFELQKFKSIYLN